MNKPKGPPLWAVDAARKVSRAMTKVQRKMAPAGATLLEIVSGAWRPYALGVVAELGIADLLAGGPRTVADLARETGTDEAALFRILRPLAHDGILDRPKPRAFALTALSQPLRSDHPQSVRQSIRRQMHHENLLIWAEMVECVRTGEPAFERLHGGRDLWTWFAEEAPEQGRVFHDSMAEMTRLMLPLVLAAHDFGRYGRILDVGGGQGVLVAGILAQFPSAKAGILDLPQALGDAPQTLERAGVRDRCELIEGNLHDGIPAGWDAYLMKHILHGMPADALPPLLGKFRDALGDAGRLIVLEMLVPEEAGGTYPARVDLQMLVGSGGRERTAGEYRELFAESGLRLDEVARTASPLSLLIVSKQ